MLHFRHFRPSSAFRLPAGGAGGVTVPARDFSSSPTFFQDIPLGPKDPILGITEAFRADPFEGKINVGVGAYRDDTGKPWILPSVAEAQTRIVSRGSNMEYPPISGIPEFVSAAQRIAYGAEHPKLKQGKIAALQSLSGTGALHLIGRFLAKFPPHPVQGKPSKIFLPNPTWGNHRNIFDHCGLESEEYRYWDPESKGVDWDGLTQDLSSKVQPGDVVLFHACAHNPTGVDLTTEQWKDLSALVREQKALVLFDNAYQGFASGDLVHDGRAITQFVEDGHSIMLCQSFAKNFGLYGQRVGLASVVCKTPEIAAAVESQLKILARSQYSNPPLHGARIVAEICNDPELYRMWEEEIRMMSGRIREMRTALKGNLESAGSSLNWDHITEQIGMFSYTGLSPEQCERMTKEHHVYLTKDGRISMAGVTSGNVKALAEAIHAVTKA